jgi:hypothetical protein
VAFSFAAVTASGQSAAAMSAAVPGVPRPADIGFDYCGICTIINLANAIVPPATPALPPPSVESGIGHWANFEFASALLHHVIFEARAPPQAWHSILTGFTRRHVTRRDTLWVNTRRLSQFQELAFLQDRMTAQVSAARMLDVSQHNAFER